MPFAEFLDRRDSIYTRHLEVHENGFEILVKPRKPKSLRAIAGFEDERTRFGLLQQSFQSVAQDRVIVDDQIFHWGQHRTLAYSPLEEAAYHFVSSVEAAGK